MIILGVLSMYIIVEMLRLNLTVKEVAVLLIDLLFFPVLLFHLITEKQRFKSSINGWVSYRQKSLIGLFFKVIFRYV
jgi:hypothetical protein